MRTSGATASNCARTVASPAATATGLVPSVFTWTVTHQALHPAYADDVPYALLVVEMDEGVRMVSTLRDLDPVDLALDLPVEVVFETRVDTATSVSITLPCFRPSTRR